MWVEFVSYPNKARLFVNPFYITAILDHKLFSVIRVQGMSFDVMETPEEIMKKIEDYNNTFEDKDFDKAFDSVKDTKEDTNGTSS